MRTSQPVPAPTSRRTQRRVGAASALALVVGMLAVPVATSASAAAATAPMAAPAAGGSHGKGGPLTPRLQKLADPAFADLPAPARARALGLPLAGPASIQRRPGGKVLVDVRVRDTSPATMAGLRSGGSDVVFTDASLRIVTMAVPTNRLRALAARPQVISVEEVLEPATAAACPTGILSEGDAMLKADVARATHAVDGTGVRVGVLSDSYNRRAGAATDVTNGELPGTTNPCGYTTPVVLRSEGGSGADEGRAMAQIVHDLAPAADVSVASAFNGEQDFANQIRGLANDGAKVIVDDVTYFAEPMYQDGVIGTAVEDVQAQGVTYFSDAGNENARVNGQDVGSYEAQAFRPMPCPAAVAAFEGPGADCHNFNPDAAGTADATYGLSLNGGTQYILGWDQPQFGITSDLDLFLLNSTGGIAAVSGADNLATQRAYETFGANARGNFSIVVARYKTPTMSTPRFKFVSWRSAITAAEYPVSNGGDVVGPTTFGHNASRSGATVGAIPYNDANAMESYSSAGPATYCWAPVRGTTPAARLSSCESTTVDLSATDGTANSFFGALVNGVWRFYGTSASAPHAAAVAALIKQDRPCLSPSQVLDAMKSTAVALPGVPTDWMGAGRVDADAAVAAAEATPCDTTPPVVTVSVPAAPASGWFTTGPVVGTVTATDTPGGVASISCTGATTGQLTRSGTFASTATASLTATGDGVHDIVCTAKDTVGNDGADPASANTSTVRIDTTAPVASPTAAPAANAAGWNSSDVTVTWNWSDAAGGSGLTAGCATSSTTTDEGAAVSVTSTCSDAAGNSGAPASVTVKVDKTAPTLAPTVTPDPVALNGTATATPNATDALSGIATQSCGTPTTSTIGSQTVSCTATDVAGNTTTVTKGYTVGAFFGSFIYPAAKITLAKSISSIPVKFTLRDGDGPLSSAASAALAANGQVQAVLVGPDPSTSVVLSAPCTWSTTNLYFQCVLKTTKALTPKVTYYLVAQESAVGGPFFDVPGSGNRLAVTFK